MKKVIEMSESIECVRSLLESHGIAYTSQREEILNLFVMDPKHYKPDEVFKKLRKKGIGIATVYRTLELLKNSDILKEISIGKERFFELKKNEKKCIYVHFKCEGCGAIRDYYDAETAERISDIVDSVESKMETKIEDVTIMVSGLCKNCKDCKGCKN